MNMGEHKKRRSVKSLEVVQPLKNMWQPLSTLIVALFTFHLRAKNADVRWNAHQYDLLTEHGEPDLAELAQHLAQAFHLKPPKGYAAAHRWRKRARSTRCDRVYLSTLIALAKMPAYAGVGSSFITVNSVGDR